jgi:hypothetical protein
MSGLRFRKFVRWLGVRLRIRFREANGRLSSAVLHSSTATARSYRHSVLVVGVFLCRCYIVPAYHSAHCPCNSVDRVGASDAAGGSVGTRRNRFRNSTASASELPDGPGFCGTSRSLTEHCNLLGPCYLAEHPSDQSRLVDGARQNRALQRLPDCLRHTRRRFRKRQRAVGYHPCRDTCVDSVDHDARRDSLRSAEHSSRKLPSPLGNLSRANVKSTAFPLFHKT